MSKECVCGHDIDTHREYAQFKGKINMCIFAMPRIIDASLQVSKRYAPICHCEGFKESFESIINTLAQPDSEDPRI